MKKRVIALFVTGAAASAFAGGTYHRVALLMPEQETPPTVSTGFGAGTFEIDTCANTVSYVIVYSCLTGPETAAHIHGFAAPGAAAGVVHPLPGGNVKVGVWNYPEADENAILAGRTYVNIHTAANPGGEIRGQIVSHVAILDALQEVPANGSPARGFGLYNIDTVNDTLSYYIAYGGLTAAETAAHFHGVARHGQNAGVLFPLPAGSPKVGVWNYPAAQEANILNGLLYTNIHTAANPGGEIRGQMTPLVVPVDGTQETPSIATPGAAVGLLSINPAANELGYYIRSCGLSAAETAAHIHGFAPRGSAAGVLTPLPAGANKLGFWAYGAANAAGLLGGRTYINIHTAANPGGEVRGQIEFPRQPCIGDFNCDRTIDLVDLARLLAGFGAPGNKDDGDITGDGIVDLADLTLELSAFGSTCP